MKLKLYILILLCGSWSYSFGQGSNSTASVLKAADLELGKESGVFIFFMPKGSSAEDIELSKKYYVNYFTVDYTPDSGQVKITMVNNDEKSRAVITRFLTANGVQEVNVGGVIVPLGELFDRYLK
jgi:hypothetical protein